MEAIPAKLTGKLIEEMDALVHEGYYANRSEFIRDAVRIAIRRVHSERLEASMKEDVEWGLRGKN